MPNIKYRCSKDDVCAHRNGTKFMGTDFNFGVDKQSVKFFNSWFIQNDLICKDETSI